jgi:acyl carrier protein
MVPMTPEQVVLEIQRIIDDLMHQKGLEVVTVAPHSRFLGEDIPIDSLDLAVLVTELEHVTRKDPFRSGFRDFRTVGELAQLYAE